MKELLIILFQDSFSAIATQYAGSKNKSNALERTYSITQSLQQDKFIFYDHPIPAHSTFAENNTYKEYLQLGIDEQECMMNAFIKGFIKDYDSIVLIKNNFPGLTSDMIASAFLQLQSNDYVLGPSKDGNFYLLGMKKLDTFLFEEKISGTSGRSACDEIILTLNIQNQTYYKLSELEGFKKEQVFRPKTFLKSKVNGLQLISQN